MHRAFGLPGRLEPAFWIAAGLAAFVLVSRQSTGQRAGLPTVANGPLIAAPRPFPSTIDPTTGGPVVTEVPPGTYTTTPAAGAIDPSTGLALDPRQQVTFP